MRSLSLLIVAGLLWVLGQGLSAQPSDPLATAHDALRRGETTRAVALADAELGRNPRSRAALTLKIEALTSANDWETAIDVYDVLLALNGEDDRRLLEALSRAFLREMVALYPQVRVVALSRLACAGDRQALLELRRALIQARPDDLEALTASARLGELQGVAGLRAVATGGPLPSRAPALQALQRVRDRSASEAVLAAVEHEDLYLRLTGIRAARLLAVEDARPRLRLLLGDSNVFVAAEAAASLATLGDVDAVGRLKALRTHPSPDVRLAVLIGLLSQGADPTVLTALEAVARSRNGSAWLAALETLLDAAPTRGAELLREALGDPNPNVRLLALRLFPRAGLPAAQDLAALRLQLREPQNFIKMEAATAILGPTDLCVP